MRRKFLQGVFLAVLMAMTAWSLTSPVQAVTQKSIIMYSASYCPFCTGMRNDFKEAGLAFSEYFIDQDDSKKQELVKRLRAAGESESLGVPVIFVGDAVFRGRQPVEDIRAVAFGE